MSDAYMLGEDAYSRGDTIDMNPYEERDAQHDEWDDGFSVSELNNIKNIAKDILKRNDESNRKLNYEEIINCIRLMVEHWEEMELEINKLNDEIQSVMAKYWQLQRGR